MLRRSHNLVAKWLSVDFADEPFEGNCWGTPLSLVNTENARVQEHSTTVYELAHLLLEKSMSQWKDPSTLSFVKLR